MLQDLETWKFADWLAELPTPAPPTTSTSTPSPTTTSHHTSDAFKGEKILISPPEKKCGPCFSPSLAFLMRLGGRFRSLERSVNGSCPDTCPQVCPQCPEVCGGDCDTRDCSPDISSRPYENIHCNCTAAIDVRELARYLPQPYCYEPVCPEPVCPEPVCPKPTCPEPVCPEPVCPKPLCVCKKPVCPRPVCGKVVIPPCPFCAPACPILGKTNFFETNSTCPRAAKQPSTAEDCQMAEEWGPGVSLALWWLIGLVLAEACIIACLVLLRRP